MILDLPNEKKENDLLQSHENCSIKNEQLSLEERAKVASMRQKIEYIKSLLSEIRISITDNKMNEKIETTAVIDISDKTEQKKVTDKTIDKETLEIQRESNDKVENLDSKKKETLYLFQNQEEDEHLRTLLNYKQYNVLNDPNRSHSYKGYKYNAATVTEILSLVEKKGMSMYRASEIVGVAHHVVRYWCKRHKKKVKCQEEKETRKPKSIFEIKHYEFFQELIEKNPYYTIYDYLEAWNKQFEEARTVLEISCFFLRIHCGIVPNHRHNYLCNLNKTSNIEKRYMLVSELIKSGVDFSSNCVFVGEADFFLKRKEINKQLQVQSGKRLSVRQRFIIAFFPDSIIRLSDVKIDDDEIDMFAADPYYFVNFIKQVIYDLQDIKGFKPKYIVLSSPLPKYSKIIETVSKSGYQPVCLPPFALGLNPTIFFWRYLRLICKQRVSITRHASSIQETIVKGIESMTLKDIQKSIDYSKENLNIYLSKKPIIDF